MDAYGLTGFPLGHSVSPEIHRRIFALEAIPYTYEVHALSPEQFGSRLPDLFRLKGFNITLPHKERIIPYLDELHDSAAFYGSVNTVLRRENGTHIGFNTDCDGFLRTLESHEIAIAGSVCVLGAGGVGRMFALECLRRGARVAVAVRESGRERAARLAEEAEEKTGRPLRVLDIAALDEPFDLLINATPAGMYPHADACPVSPKAAARCKAVFDCIYNPRETQLLRTARQAGAKTAGGTDMLVWQAVAAHQYWHGTALPEATVQAMIPEIEAYVAARYGEGSHG